MGDRRASATRPYEGSEPYAFVSYAHADDADVLPALEALAAKGLRFWFDEGIESGDQWRETIATKAAGCSALVFFHSKNSATSKWCRREVTSADDADTPIVVVRLDDSPYADAMRLILSEIQHIDRFGKELDEVVEKTLTAGCLKPCIKLAAPRETRAKTKQELEAEGIIIASAMCSKWKREGRIPAGREIDAQVLNRRLEKARLIEKVDGSWVPTTIGAVTGICQYTDTKGGRSFTNVAYPPAAQEAILDMWVSGKLD